MNENTPQRLLASFGRRHGRKLRPMKQGLMDTLLPALTISLPPAGMLDPKALFPDARRYWLEIGFGGGEHLAHQARLHPQTGIIGCEPFINGIAGLLNAVRRDALDNIRIFSDDARLLLERLPDASMEKVFILYADPWPKTRHNKRRLISTGFLTVLARVMKPGSILQLATDDSDYVTWMLERLLTHPDFTWLAKTSDDWLTPPTDWLSTRYEQKALAAGRVPTYLLFRRR